jgi:hypothetical protein
MRNIPSGNKHLYIDVSFMCYMHYRNFSVAVQAVAISWWYISKPDIFKVGFDCCAIKKRYRQLIISVRVHVSCFPDDDRRSVRSQWSVARVPGTVPVQHVDSVPQNEAVDIWRDSWSKWTQYISNTRRHSNLFPRDKPRSRSHLIPAKSLAKLRESSWSHTRL